ncbi:MAG: hypothetical protein AAFU49_12880, partial [Pseudomonadota bacterium]
MKQYVPVNGRETGWDAGILTTEGTNSGRPSARDPRPWRAEWEIKRNTLVVIDYTHAFDDVARAIFERATSQSRFAIRLILLDHVMPRFLERDFFWRRMGGGHVSRIGQIETEYLEAPIHLKGARDNSKLTRHVIAAAASVGKRGDERYGIENPTVLRAAAHLEGLGTDIQQKGAVRHPLFAGLLGQIIRENEGGDIDLSAWQRRDLLTYYFDAPDRLPWTGWTALTVSESQRSELDRRLEKGLVIGAVVSAATLRRGLAVRDVARRVDWRPEELDDLMQRAGRVVSSDDPNSIPPLLPDILGETFVLQFLQEARNRPALFELHMALLTQDGPQDAQEIADSYRDTVARTARNLANDDQCRPDVERAWEALCSILSPKLVEDGAPLRLAMSYAIADTMEQMAFLIERTRNKLPHDFEDQTRNR